MVNTRNKLPAAGEADDEGDTDSGEEGEVRRRVCARWGAQEEWALDEDTNERPIQTEYMRSGAQQS
jgi:hypothetical protein